MMHSLMLAIRRLTRTPGFAFAAIATVAIAIGANATVFSVIDSVILSPLPFGHAEQLVWVNFTAPGLGYAEMPFSQAAFTYVRETQHAFQTMALFKGSEFTVQGASNPTRIAGERVSPEFFEVLDVRPTLGRAFTAIDAVPGGTPVVILSDALWTNAFGGDSAIIGRSILVDGTSRQVVGVAPTAFAFPSPDDQLWVPLSEDKSIEHAGDFSFPCIARLRAGESLATARADIARLVPRIGAVVPDLTPSVVEKARFAPVVRDLRERIVGDIRQPLLLALVAAAFILLIACANVGGLFLIRLESRARELAVRTALGASRANIIGDFISEGFVVALVAGAGGLALAGIGVRGILTALPSALPRTREVGVNADVVLFTLGLAAIAGVIFTALPLWRRSATPGAGLRDEGRTATTSRGGARLRAVLVGAQLAVATVLLICTGLMMRTAYAASRVNPGFRADHVLTFDITLLPAQYPAEGQLEEFWRSLDAQLSALPGVESVGRASSLPLGRGIMNGSIFLEDHPASPGTLMPVAERQYVGPGYFATLRIPILRGRALGAHDGARETRSVVVNESFAEHWWPHQDPVGRRVRQSANEPWYEIVGVSGDVRFTSLEKRGTDVVYFPSVVGAPNDPQTLRHMAVAVRTISQPEALAPAARATVTSLDAGLPIANVQTLAEVVKASMARVAFTLVIFEIAGVIALMLGVMGVYGTTAYVVAQRQREIGVRMALGATANSVRRLILQRSLATAFWGIGFGILFALAFTGALRTLLYGVTANDTMTYVTVTVVLIAATLLASFVPAVRASSIDPAESLRGD